ncbi:MAG: VOC family protein [Cyanobacteria bacterium J06626_18]
MLEFDHLFVFTQFKAPEADAVVAAGFREGSRNSHPGQGTANRRVFLTNAMVEFLWVCTPAETATLAIAPMQFGARSNYRQSGYSPFGIALRYCSGIVEEKSLPFDTWAYRPPYLPSQLQFEVAHTRPQEPLIFILPFDSTRPDQFSPAKRQPLDHPNAIQEITALHLTVPVAEPRSPALLFLQAAAIAKFTQGEDHLATLECDHAIQGQSADFRPQLPLSFHY